MCPPGTRKGKEASKGERRPAARPAPSHETIMPLLPRRARALPCALLALLWWPAQAAADATPATLTALARWVRGEAAAPPPSSPPPTRFALFTTAASPACAAACALVLLAGGPPGGGGEGGGDVIASTTPLRPHLVAAVSGGGDADGTTAKTRLTARVRCAPGSGCAPVGPAAAGVGLWAGGGDGSAPALVLGGLTLMRVRETVTVVVAPAATAAPRSRASPDTYQSSLVHLDSRGGAASPPAAGRPPSLTPAAAVDALGLPVLGGLALVNGLVVGFVRALWRRGRA